MLHMFKKNKSFAQNYTIVDTPPIVSMIFEQRTKKYTNYIGKYIFHFYVDMKKDSVHIMPNYL